MNRQITTMLKSTVASLGFLAGVYTPSAALADIVTLRSTDGTINVTGEFVDLSEDTYVLRTALGDLRIAASSVVCDGAACPSFADVSADVVIAGSQAMARGLMPLLLQGFAASMDADAEIQNTGVNDTVATLWADGGFGDEIGAYQVSATDDAAAFEALLNGESQIGLAARRITVPEARALRADGAGSMVSPQQEHIIAVDSMIVVTHPSNPVDQLTKAQLADIFAGQITNWSEVGGPDKDINVITQTPGSASDVFFMEYLFDEGRPEGFLPQGIAADDQSLSNTMFHDVNAIGYLGYAFQRGAKAIAVVNECGIAATPDAFSAKTEEYELARRMYLYNRSDNLDGASEMLINFVNSGEADAVIGKSGFIDLGIARRVQGAEDARYASLMAAASRYDAGFEGEVMQEMLDLMTGTDRLSTTFRFRTGSSKLDERGRLDLQRLISYLETVPGGTNVTLVGFTDDVGAFQANRNLSVDRASQMADEIRSAAAGRLNGITFANAGFGEIAPSACNSTDRGRGINRRVEVWISNGIDS